jgi:hypothetical protein
MVRRECATELWKNSLLEESQPVYLSGSFVFGTGITLVSRVKRLRAVTYDNRTSIPGSCKRLFIPSQRSDRLLGPSSLLSNG